MKAHPHSAVSRCSGVWSPAPPPSAQTGSGRSGTARTLAAPAAGSWCRGACRVRSPRPLNVPRDCSVYPHSWATSRNRNAAVLSQQLSPRHDITMVDGVVEGRPDKLGLQCCSRQSVGCHFPVGGAQGARVSREDLVYADPSTRQGFPDCSATAARAG